MYYFDYAANYPVKKEVLDELCKVETDFFGNANSLHTLGQKAKLAYDIYDSKIKNILKLDDNYEIIFFNRFEHSLHNENIGLHYLKR